jgi:putative tryptophan/tyrosine transport system substrate-binding protein
VVGSQSSAIRSRIFEFEEKANMKIKLLVFSSGNSQFAIRNPKFLFFFCAVLFALSFPAQAQQSTGKVPRIGFLTTASASDPQTTLRLDAFRQGLRDLGYVEGKTVNIDYRYADGKPERLPELIEELLRLKVDILLATNATVARAAKRSDVTIPIVAPSMGDLTGLVESLARPGSNVTGLTHISIELLGKRLELLKEVLPKVSRFMFLDDATTHGYKGVAKETQSAVKALGVQLQVVEVKSSNPDIEGVFQSMVKERIGAFITEATPGINFQRKKILALAEQNRLPAMHSEEEWVNSGGLMSYGANRTDPFRRAATYVDKILKGAKPADLPVEQPMKFEFVINLKTAKQIGLTIPPNVLARADKVIK